MKSLLLLTLMLASGLASADTFSVEISQCPSPFPMEEACAKVYTNLSTGQNLGGEVYPVCFDYRDTQVQQEVEARYSRSFSVAENVVASWHPYLENGKCFAITGFGGDPNLPQPRGR